MAVSINWGVLIVGEFRKKRYSFGVHTRARDFWKSKACKKVELGLLESRFRIVVGRCDVATAWVYKAVQDGCFCKLVVPFVGVFESYYLGSTLGPLIFIVCSIQGLL